MNKACSVHEQTFHSRTRAGSELLGATEPHTTGLQLLLVLLYRPTGSSVLGQEVGMILERHDSNRAMLAVGVPKRHSSPVLCASHLFPRHRPLNVSLDEATHVP